MIAYKGFRGNLTCTLGKGTMQYDPGDTIREERSKAARTGMHCAEYVLDCLSYYPLGQGNRYFEVEASGSIDEDGSDTKIACTEMTLVKELSIKEIAFRAMAYMVDHPQREWEKKGTLLDVSKEEAVGAGKGSIAIARGKDPRVKGKTGTVAGLLVENEDGEIENARYFVIDGKERKPDVWYRITGPEKEAAG